MLQSVPSLCLHKICILRHGQVVARRVGGGGATLKTTTTRVVSKCPTSLLLLLQLTYATEWSVLDAGVLLVVLA